MTSQTPTADRRQAARLPVPWPLTGPVLDRRPGRLVDLSSTGSRIEHTDAVYEGLICEVDLPPALGRGRFKGRVIWTRPHKPVRTREGDTRVLYQTGLAFVETTPEQQEALMAALRILQTGELPDGTSAVRTDCPHHPGGHTTGQEGGTMPADAPELTRLAAQLEVLADRLTMLEVQVRALMESPTVDAQEFLVRDGRGHPRARLEMQQHAPCLVFYDSSGKERLRIGLRMDGSPFVQVEQRSIPLGDG